MGSPVSFAKPLAGAGEASSRVRTGGAAKCPEHLSHFTWADLLSAPSPVRHRRDIRSANLMHRTAPRRRPCGRKNARARSLDQVDHRLCDVCVVGQAPVFLLDKIRSHAIELRKGEGYRAIPFGGSRVDELITLPADTYHGFLVDPGDEGKPVVSRRQGFVYLWRLSQQGGSWPHADGRPGGRAHEIHPGKFLGCGQHLVETGEGIEDLVDEIFLAVCDVEGGDAFDERMTSREGLHRHE